MKALKRSLFPALCIVLAVMLAVPAAAVCGYDELVPMGCTVGIVMSTDGVLVAGLAPIEENGGMNSPAGEAGVLPGDMIIKIGSTPVSSAAELMTALASTGLNETTLTIRRGDRTIQYSVVPLCGSDGCPKLGLWLRDGVTGIGTMTFYDPETGLYGALGHGINDVDTGVLMPISSGSITEATVVDVKAGVCGTPGELRGNIEADSVIGDICANTDAGIFGEAEQPGGEFKAVEVADRSDIQVGKATVLANVDGDEVSEYEVEISRVYRDDHGGRDFMLTVTDEELLGVTGGIVQGMSGSPILQNGKLIGAVTHVLVNDPTKGYGISIENMLSAAENYDRAA